MKTKTIIDSATLIKGQPYMVKHFNGNKTVRRVYRGTEQRFGNIECLVFTSKVGKNVFAEVQENPNGVTFWKWRNTQTVPAQDVSIPYYDVVTIQKATI